MIRMLSSSSGAVLVVLQAIVLAGSPITVSLASEPAPQMEMGRPAQMDQIASMLGEWNVAIEMRMAPDEPFAPTTGQATVTATLDGCVQQTDFRADVMGMPLKGLEFTTFNRQTGQFESVWVDNFSGNIAILRGGFDEGRLVMTGVNNMTGQEVYMRGTREKRSDSEVYWTMDESYDGGKTWTTSMKMTYTRK
jgi:hypothetical protein